MMVRPRENETMMRCGDGEANKITNLVDKLLAKISNYLAIDGVKNLNLHFLNFFIMVTIN